MTLSGSLRRAEAILVAAGAAARADDPLAQDVVAELAAALRGFGPFEQVGWVLGDVRAGSTRAWVMPAPGFSDLVAWGQSAAMPVSGATDRGARVLAGVELRSDAAAAVLASGCDRALAVPLAGDPTHPSWLVAGWNAGAGELDDETIATLGLLAHTLGPSLAWRRRRQSSAPPATRIVPALSDEHAAQVAVAGRWASLGTLAGGLVHEINNPATFIALAAGQIEKGVAAAMASGDPSKLSQLTELTSGIQEATRQIRGLVSDFRQFVGGAGKSAMLTVDLERVLQAACAMTKVAHRHDAVLETRIEAIPPCPGRFLALGPAAVNVLVNGIESLGDGPRPRCVELAAAVRDEVLEVRVTDTGGGVAPEHLPMVFEPFFTTKPTDVHAGIGLTVARSAVRGLGGQIELDSEPGVGTSVVMKVPMP